MAYWQLRKRCGFNFEGNKKMFCMEVKLVKRSEQRKDEMVKEAKNQLLQDGANVRKRWAEYFEQLLAESRI